MKRAFASIHTAVPGPESLRCFEQEQRHIAPGLQSIALLSKVAFHRGQGALLEDLDGNRYLDFFAGVGVASLGHAHPRWVQALHEQASRIAVGSFATRTRQELCAMLADLAPGRINRVQFYSGGAEAVEAALRLARSATGRSEFMSFWGGFHGKTGGVLGLLGDSFKHGHGPLMPGRYLTPYADCRHCGLGHEFPECEFACVKFLGDKVVRETTNRLAGILVEPIQGTAGNIIPPAGYLHRLQQEARRHGALLLVDESITGFGRTGKMFCCEHEQLEPDVLILGKGFGAGFPVTAVMTTEDLAHSPPFSDPSGSSSSFGGNPLAAAAALATVKTLVEENLVENSARVGAFMLERLQAMAARHPLVGGVWGRGLLLGMELVGPDGDPLERTWGRLFFAECLRRGLLVMGYQSRVRIQPPLVIRQEMAEEGLEILEEALNAVGDQLLAKNVLR